MAVTVHNPSPWRLALGSPSYPPGERLLDPESVELAVRMLGLEDLDLTVEARVDTWLTGAEGWTNNPRGPGEPWYVAVNVLLPEGPPTEGEYTAKLSPVLWHELGHVYDLHYGALERSVPVWDYAVERAKPVMELVEKFGGWRNNPDFTNAYLHTPSELAAEAVAHRYGRMLLTKEVK